ncbi:hypothetical protein CH381_13350 [Leptospira sp. mixed culture ATI2-C-A1]|nr:hypothetical protein CH381_13350 [Leptospira sp. mixed culture ATI2-C-A1]
MVSHKDCKEILLERSNEGSSRTYQTNESKKVARIISISIQKKTKLNSKSPNHLATVLHFYLTKKRPLSQMQLDCKRKVSTWTKEYP